MEKAGKIKIIVDKKKGADGREFFAAGIRGKYIPKDLAKALGAEEERYYAIRPVGVSLPQKKGVWSVSFSDSWIDKRKPDFQIIRLRDPSFDFEKELLIAFRKADSIDKEMVLRVLGIREKREDVKIG